MSISQNTALFSLIGTIFDLESGIVRFSGGREIDPRLDIRLQERGESFYNSGLERVVADLEAAGRFVDNRLAAYDRMWDGCGCKVDYDREP